MRRLRMNRALALVLLAACLGAAPAAADVAIAVGEEFPVRNSPVEIELTGLAAGMTYDLHVTYRPNSETSKEEKIGSIDIPAAPPGNPDSDPAPGVTSGTLQWTPRDAGITSIRVMSGGEQLVSKNVAVRFDKAPISGILVFLGAGLLLFGGATTSMRRALGG